MIAILLCGKLRCKLRFIQPRARFFTCLVAFLFLGGVSLFPQSFSGEQELPGDPAQPIGLTLSLVYARYGVPESVYTIRGAEEWQDDVVFVYNDRDMYVFKDRVWQVSVRTAYGITLGDPGGVVSLILGDGVQSFSGYLLYALPSRSWPLQLRVNLDNAGRVESIFIYRSDF
ncbi:hypothetical protein TREPR_1797 [Treponema primitia ZAS-2]|uniref:Uncharacterized protein n=1 Tax=Treponema primitia (strain ATCC BAA-887 / DSM 12427 / ZAS-2) TaxID=545694 RepID=F5YLZ5_TREPZ|nr:hypothetical protein [Treponema primitia]AEF85302.1 hypothetical protein TREPR_1797 [Treponema primitia ZAS-2]